MNCSNLTRTCFICHDPDIWVNPRKDEIEPYHFVYDPSIPMPEEKVYSGQRIFPVGETDVSRIKSSQSVHKESYVPHASELCSESLNLSVE